jgi:hypothetical protein
MSVENETIELVSRMYQTLKEQGSFIKVSSAGVVSIDEERLPVKEVLKFLQPICKANPEYTPLLLGDASAFLSAFRIIHAQTARARPAYEESEVRNYNYAGLIPFQSVTDATRYVLFDTNLGSVMDLDFKTFKENRDTAGIDPIRGRIEFNPYSPKPIDFRPDQYGRPCNFLNTYKKPEWQEGREITKMEAEGCKPPQIFIDFMLHLFPDKECRTFVLDWLHFALTDRCETYLVLNGAKGIGKNLFSENLCKPLMGINNHKIAQPSALTSDFNALLRDSRMIVFDEFRVDSAEKINKLKRYVNEEQMIERKGVDVDATTKTYNSFIISNNDMADMKISWDDRRFSVADITKIKLREAWTKEKIDEFLALCKDPYLMKQLGYWIMYRKPTHTKFDAYKKRHFYDLCYTSFSEWQKVLVDLATSKQYREITNTDLKKEYRRRTETTRLPSYARIKDFIENYRHEGEYSLGEVFKQTSEVWVLSLADKFAGEEVYSEPELDHGAELLV